MKGLLSLVSGKFTTFCSHCTLHGFYYLSGPTSCLVRVLWCIIISAGFLLSVMLSILIWEKFNENPTFTVVESAHYPTEDILFPAVAACDPRVYGPATANITNILTMRGFTANQLEKFYQSFFRVKSKSFMPDPEVTRMHNILEEINFSYYDLLYELKKPCSELLKECSWRGKTIDCSHMFRDVFTVYGYCCQFDINYFKDFADNDTNLVAGVLKLEALDIIVDSTKVYPNGTTRAGHVMLYIFDQKNQLTLLDSPITLTPATYFDVSIDVWIIEAWDEVKSLPLESRTCFLESDGMASYDSCVSDLLMEEIVATCLCLPFNYEGDEFGASFSPCKWQKLSCVYRALDDAQRRMRSILSQRQCYQTCDYVQYETKTDYTKPMRQHGVRSRFKNKDGLSRVTVHFADSICIKYKREVLYTWDQLLANLGGIFGLCLGGSIISVIELFWFIFDIIVSVLNYLCRKTKKDENVLKGKKILVKSALRKENSVATKYPFIN